jgi:hypothetical protein
MPRKKSQPEPKIWVATAEAIEARGVGLQQLDIDQLAANVSLFVEQMGGLLKNTPEKLGKFQFVEFEVHADISGEGQLTLLGTGAKVGAAGGIKFVFRRSPAE